jgi:cell division protein FtsW
MPNPPTGSPLLQPSIYRMRLADILILCVLGLLSLGILMVQSASMRITEKLGWHWTDYGLRHIMYVGIALAVFFIIGQIDYARLLPARHLLASPIIWFVLLAAAACFLVLIPHVGREVNGARRWLSLGVTQVQPSELGKWAVVLFLAWWLTTRPVDLDNFFGFLLTFIPVGAICLLVVIEDFGTAALIGVTTIAMCLAGRIRLRHLVLVIPPALAVAFWFVRHKEYRWKRMTSFIDPFANPEKEGYHMIQSLLSFATGGIFGKGLGRGIQKLGYLPEDTTDFIFSVICEELGLFGALLTIALYLGILYVAWQAIRRKKDSFGQLLAFGISTTICFQALINIAVATVSVPPKGMSLPLVSFGGSGLVITCAALGVLYSVCKHSHDEEQATSPALPAGGFEVGPIAALVAAA